MTTLCRDCVSLAETPAAACSNCGGARWVSHPKLETLSVAHIDCDAFFAAIEKRDNPSLRDKPVIVGGGRRGVVSTCCYIARLYGVRSAMPMFKALKACPEAMVVKPNYEKYVAAAKILRARMEALTPLVQPVSIDEAYLDLSGTTRINAAPPAGALAQLAIDIERDVGITVSIGLSENRFLAKMASELDKPRGFAVLSLEDAPAHLAPLKPGAIHGVGPKFAAKLERDGIKTIADLQAAEVKTLIRRYGETGLWLHERAFGRDNRPVDPDGERKSVSSETTFDSDLRDGPALEDRLWTLCVKTADRAKASGVEGSVVTLKLKRADFQTITRRTSIQQPTQLAQTLFRAALPLLKREIGPAYRLIGIGLSTLSDAQGDARDLIDPSVAKRAAAERAADAARAKFGSDAVMTGRAARLQRLREPQAKE